MFRVPLPVDTPLGPYKQFLDGPPIDVNAEQAALEATHSEQEEVIASCMKREGFEYGPKPYAYNLEAESKGLTWAKKAAGLPVPTLAEDRSLVEKWGYGIDPPDYYDILPVDEDLLDEAVESEERYLNTLSETARMAYRYALTGSDYQLGGPGIPPEAIGGCMGKAYEQVPDAPSGSTAFNDEFWDLAVQVADLTHVDVPADPRALEASERWNACMLAKEVDVGGDVADDADTMYMTRPTPWVADSHARELAVNEDGLPSLQATPSQIEVALADFDCRAETRYIDAIIEVQRDLEQKFLEQHRNELDRMRAAAGG
jgi:hypothetical protein